MIPQLYKMLLLQLKYRRLVECACLLSILLTIYHIFVGLSLTSTPAFSYPWKFIHHRLNAPICTPTHYANGSWVYHPKTYDANMTSPKDALAFSEFQGCASSREYFWHLAADREDQYDRFPRAHSWEWKPGEGCENLQRLDPEELVRDLVEDGAWYLVGDSVSENHFFSLSCLLYPHVYATPNYMASADFDRAWPQNLYLSPSSPLVQSISFPQGFNITLTPLATFRRIDLLLSKDELVDIHRSAQVKSLDGESLFSDESVWTLPLEEYLTQFLSSLPSANYATMIVSTGGHWTTTLFPKVSPPGMEGILALFESSMEQWARNLQNSLRERNEYQKMRGANKRVVVRAYLPGHENCHESRQPWSEIQPFVWNWYNWADIWKFNSIFEGSSIILQKKPSLNNLLQRLLSDRKLYPDIYFLPIDRPGRLRPDAHTTGDCLHIMSGAGVLEGWTLYIWHFVRNHSGAEK